MAGLPLDCPQSAAYPPGSRLPACWRRGVCTAGGARGGDVGHGGALAWGVFVAVHDDFSMYILFVK